ncbi:MAG: hypothetical protein R2752_21420 [Vicinamibacterales bacterium]
MTFDDIQAAWKETPMTASLPADDALVRAALATDRTLARRVAVRDLVELVTAAGLTALWIWMAVLTPVKWPWVAAAVVTAGVGLVFVRERRRRRTTMVADAADAADAAGARAVRVSLAGAMAEVDHQIALLRSVVWWYLLPLALVALLVVLGALLGARAEVPPDVWARTRWGFVGAFVAVGPFIAGIFGLVWWLNVRAVRTQLEPHRRALADLLAQVREGGE